MKLLLCLAVTRLFMCDNKADSSICRLTYLQLLSDVISHLQIIYKLLDRSYSEMWANSHGAKKIISITSTGVSMKEVGERTHLKKSKRWL